MPSSYPVQNSFGPLSTKKPNMTSNHKSEGLVKEAGIMKGDSNCSYRDYSMEAGKGQALDESFPIKLHYMLADVQMDGNDHIVAWHSHGR